MLGHRCDATDRDAILRCYFQYNTGFHYNCQVYHITNISCIFDTFPVKRRSAAASTKGWWCQGSCQHLLVQQLAATLLGS